MVVNQADRRPEVVIKRTDRRSKVVVDKCYCFLKYFKLQIQFFNQNFLFWQKNNIKIEKIFIYSYSIIYYFMSYPTHVISNNYIRITKDDKYSQDCLPLHGKGG